MIRSLKTEKCLRSGEWDDLFTAYCKKYVTNPLWCILPLNKGNACPDPNLSLFTVANLC